MRKFRSPSSEVESLAGHDIRKSVWGESDLIQQGVGGGFREIRKESRCKP